METVNIQSWYKMEPVKLWKGTDELITETEGYLPTHILIGQAILAGQRLKTTRTEMYDSYLKYGEEFFYDENWQENIESMEPDPTRNGGFDLSDASRIMYEADEKLKQVRFEQRKLEKEKKDKEDEQRAVAEKKASIEALKVDLGIKGEADAS